MSNGPYLRVRPACCIRCATLCAILRDRGDSGHVRCCESVAGQLPLPESGPKLAYENTTSQHLFSWRYGYGIWMTRLRNSGMKYILSGGDPGVDFRSSCYPERAVQIVAIGNTTQGAGEIAKALEHLVESETPSLK